MLKLMTLEKLYRPIILHPFAKQWTIQHNANTQGF
jgi:hypothetical protein